MNLPSARRLALGAAAIAGIALLPMSAASQPRAIGWRTSSLGPLLEVWSFGDGMPQHFDGDSVLVRRVVQWSVPVSAVVPLGRRWTFDVSGAYASGEVELDGADPTLDTERYELAGLTDVKVRLVGRLIGDNVMLTLGANAPAGNASLTRDELRGLAVLAAPMLRMQSVAVGTGPGGTAGLVLARSVGRWGLALAGSYEHRGSYAPIASLVAGTDAPALDPGEVVRLSVGADGLIGQHGMTLTLSTDLYSADAFTTASAGGERRTSIQLGPTATAEWQMRFAAPRLRELTLYAIDRYRSEYEQDGVTAAGSSGNQLEAGLQMVAPFSRVAGILLGVDARHHTGLKVDDALATAAFAGGGVTAGLDFGAGGTAFRVLVRGQGGKVESGTASSDARGVGGGVILSHRF